jgi:hypothetical protein
MKMSKRSRKLALCAGMLAAVAAIPPAPPAEAACTLSCPDGTSYTCENLGCQVRPGVYMTCGRSLYLCI